MKYIDLTKDEMIRISGGHDGNAYKAGVMVGSIIKFFSYAIPAGRFIKFLK